MPNKVFCASQSIESLQLEGKNRGDQTIFFLLRLLLWPGSGQRIKSLFIIIHAFASPCVSNVKQLCLFQHCQLNPLGKMVQPPFNDLSQAQKLSPHQYFSLSYLPPAPHLYTLIRHFHCSLLFIHPISYERPFCLVRQSMTLDLDFCVARRYH